MSKSIYQHV